MRMRARVALPAVGLLLAIGLGLWCMAARPDLAESIAFGRPPRIRPDYSGVVIPPNIAPLNFLLDETGARFHVRVSGEAGDALDVDTRDATVRFPASGWRALLERNRGRALRVEVWALRGDGRWGRFDPIVNRVAREHIDKYVTYRRTRPVYFWLQDRIEMGIYQRDVEGYEESAILHNSAFDNQGCMNCHASAANRSSNAVTHLRGRIGPAMLIVRSGAAAVADAQPKGARGPVSIFSLHPDGKVMAFAMLSLSLLSRSSGETREVFESASDLALYRLDTGEFVRVPAISSPDYAESWPAWSGDGRRLYFCRAKITWPPGLGDHRLPEDYREIRYDLMQIPFDPATGAWGEIETVLSLRDARKSIAQPKASPDGRFVVFCAVDYGMWPLTRPEADLVLLDTQTRRTARMACSSDRSESGPNWSSNSRWIVFSSKRKDGVFTRVYFAYVGEDGRSAKAVELPQRDPAAEDCRLTAYNLPQLTAEPMPVSHEAIVRAICARRRAEDSAPTVRAGYH